MRLKSEMYKIIRARIKPVCYIVLEKQAVAALGRKGGFNAIGGISLLSSDESSLGGTYSLFRYYDRIGVDD